MLRFIEDLASDWRRRDAHLDDLTEQIKTIACNDVRRRTVIVRTPARSSRAPWSPPLARAMSFPNGVTLSPGSALVSKQISTGIARYRYLRMLFAQAA
jgi:hypothetical protein